LVAAIDLNRRGGSVNRPYQGNRSRKNKPSYLLPSSWVKLI
jgi:hypothetical protein